jgi:phospholipid/cholesterol/gamma-HCH transport system substrate-binding protein
MEQKNTEMIVGLFVLAGLTLIAGLIIYYGNYKERFEEKYELTVTFPNANGLVKGALVFYAGARVGRVLTTPEIAADGRSVAIKVGIRKDVRIDRNASWTIGSSGLLGDAYVAITPPAKANESSEILTDGNQVKGDRTTGIGDIASSAEPVLEAAKEIAGELKEIAGKINRDWITPENSERLSRALDNASNLLAKLDDAIEAERIREIVASLQEIARKMEKVAEDAQSISGNANKLFASAGRGQGSLYQILADKETGQNLAAFVANLRKHGVLFYSDSYGKESGSDKAKSPPAQRPAPRSLPR